MMLRLLALVMITNSTAFLLHRTSISSCRIVARSLHLHINRGNNYDNLVSSHQQHLPLNHCPKHSSWHCLHRHRHQIMSLHAAAEDTMSSNKKAKMEHDESEGEDIPSAEEQTAEEYVNSLPPGLSKGYHIVSHASVPSSGFSIEQLSKKLNENEILRLEITSTNVTVPVALMMLFPGEFGTLTRARKECRRRKILVLRRPDDGGDVTDGRKDIDFDPERMIIGRVIDRVMAGDTIAIQTRTTNGGYAESMRHDKDPPFHLPVVYQDDHIAIVNKPEGVVVFGHKNGGYGRNTVKSALPYVLDPPKIGTMSILWNPMPVHRIDKATSGLLLVAKTKPAMVHLSHQFRERTVKKTYTAIVNGIPPEPKETSITSEQAKNLGVCIETTQANADKIMWQFIDKDLEEQSAVTIWRSLGRARLENAIDETVTMVELKPKTGRFHQLRRHMAWVCNSPIIGDSSYDGAGLAKPLRDNGMFLCSNKVTLEHPYYTTKSQADLRRQRSNDSDNVSITEDENGTVLINVVIDLPSKFSEIIKNNRK